jgi:hypothetical protein
MKIKLEITGFCIFTSFLLHFYFFEMIDDFIYLLQRGDHRKHRQEIYKIGHRNDFNKRINEYLIDTQVISICLVDNEKKCERELIRELKSEFELRCDMGNEYFDGNEMYTISVFNDSCSDHLPNRDEEIDMIYHWQIKDQR